ncbi:hypothetical protein KAH81_05850 [bacterium]|nr:hypothetical protein [bacterium]
MTAKEAAQKAKDFLIELLGDEVNAIRLEEVELDVKNEFWYITLSYSVASVSALENLTGMRGRVYKKLKIQNAPDGKVVDMKIRELEHTE